MQNARCAENYVACIQIERSDVLQNLQPCPVGTAVTTSGFDLPQKHLIHVVDRIVDVQVRTKVVN